MGIHQRLATVVGASLAATALAVIGFTGAADADTAYGEIRPLSGAVTGPFTGVKCLDLREQDGFTNNNARIQQWDCSGANEQQFRSHPYAKQPGGFRMLYQIQNLRSGMCVEVRDGLRSNGAQIDQYPCDSSGVVTDLNARQLWQETRVNGTDLYVVQPWSALSFDVTMCLDVSGASNSNGAKIQQYTCNGTNAQDFTGVAMVDDGQVTG